jgi:hypothetical protein
MQFLPCDFVVYELIDPRDGLPFYVGKGRAARASVSGTIGACKGQGAKLAKVRAILFAGQRPLVRIVGEFKSEQDALFHEAQHYEYLTLVRGLKLTNKIAPWFPEVRRAPISSKRGKDRYADIVKERLARRSKRQPAKTSASYRRRGEMPPLTTWCGEASDYLVACPYLPVFCVPRRFT